MAIAASPTQNAVMKALGLVLQGVLPSGIPIILGQANRVPEPKAENFVVMTPTRRPRIATNLDDYSDNEFTGSISGTTLTVTYVAGGGGIGEFQIGVTPIGFEGDTNIFTVGCAIFGDDVASGTVVTEFLTGEGGVGTYTVSVEQDVDSETMHVGGQTITQQTQIEVQLDFHGSGGADNAQVVSTLFRDQYGVSLFEDAGDVVVPLYADDPRQMPFINAQQQYEDRWIVEAVLQANPTISIAQQFAGSLNVELVNVDVVFPPS